MFSRFKFTRANIKWVLLSVSMLPGLAQAEILDVDYASFYSHVKKLDKEETSDLRFAFGFKHIAHDRLCKIEEASIITQKQTIPLNVENSNRFTVPNDKVLKMAKAIVSIKLDDNANQCDMSVQLETIPELLKRTYSASEIESLLVQYQAFFSNMGGFLSFMMPSAKGLVFHLSQEADVPAELNNLTDSVGNIVLDQTWFENKQDLTLGNVPIRITALVEK